MKKVLVLFLLLFPVLAGAAEVALDYARVVGTWSGRVENGDGLHTVTTTFTLLSGGRLRGEYRLENVSDPLRGFMTGALPMGGRQVSFEWQDRDGEGFAVLEFAPDYSNFSGGWGVYDSQRLHLWIGEKVSDEPVSLD